MKIAQIAPLCEAVPPRGYGGTERVVAYLTDALVDLGCDVTLFASAEARTRARLVPVREQSIRSDEHPLKSEYAAHLTMLRQVQAMAHEFDVLHFHLDALHFPLFETVAQHTVTTMHGRLDYTDYPALFAAWPRYALVSISMRQRAAMPKANWVANIPHGLPSASYTLSNHRGAYLAFLGRICAEKRPDVAIHIAHQAGLPLKIAAKVDAADRNYFADVIRPLLTDPLVELVGEIGDTDKNAFLGNAVALLFPIDWPEPFGLVMIESMACGTPVIAWNRGSVPEILDEGMTGAIVESIEAAVRAIAWARAADRKRIRQTFEHRFTAHLMACRYLEVYRHLLRGKRLELVPDVALAASGMMSAVGAPLIGGTGATAPAVASPLQT